MTDQDDELIFPRSVLRGLGALPGTAPAFRLTSNFHPGQDLPVKYTCNGADVSPPLAWTGAPAGTKSIALIMDDPDAPKEPWTHWVLYDIAPTASSIAEGASAGRPGRNDWHMAGYRGPCPPKGRHRYFFKLYALDAALGDLGEPNAAKLEQAMVGHVLGQAALMGTYASTK